MSNVVLIDWGTSSFRLWVVDYGFKVIKEFKSAKGMAFSKPDEYEAYLESVLKQLDIIPSVPVLICGMAGAAQGWRDAGYLDIPTGLGFLANKAFKIDTANGRDVRILPGLAQRDSKTPNVMRGEETLLLGALNLDKIYDIYCLPGTHSKWVHMSGKTVSRFDTIMTGELFALLATQSTLSHYLVDDMSDFNRNIFKVTLRDFLKKPELFSMHLFKLRAGPILFGQSDASNGRAVLSAMLIGAELTSVKDDIISTVGLIATGLQSEVYELAFQTAGIDYELIDSTELALEGLSGAAKEIWNIDEC